MSNKYRTESEVIEDLFGKNKQAFTQKEVLKVMDVYASQFKWIYTTCRTRLVCDDEDFDTLRQMALFLPKNRNHVLTVGESKTGNKTSVVVGKILLGLKGQTILHYKDKNPFNLKKDNITVINHQKAHFKEGIQKNNTSGFKGVSWNKNAKKWGASIRVNGKSKHLGYHIDIRDAVIAYNEAAKKYFGEDYAYLNEIPSKSF